MTYTQAELDKQYLEQVPSLQIVQTVGGYYRVEVSGPDSLQSQVDRPRCFSADIARDLTKEGALRKAREWLDRMRDRTPQSSSDSDEAWKARVAGYESSSEERSNG